MQTVPPFSLVSEFSNEEFSATFHKVWYEMQWLQRGEMSLANHKYLGDTALLVHSLTSPSPPQQLLYPSQFHCAWERQNRQTPDRVSELAQYLGLKKKKMKRISKKSCIYYHPIIELYRTRKILPKVEQE